MRLTLIAALCLASVPALSRDDGQWGDQPANIRMWFQSLMQPDDPYRSCCGEADAFEADEWDGPSGDGETITVTITDGRGVLPTGTKLLVPTKKIKWDQGNPTGHGILFIGSGGQIYCYVVPSGV